ncbi:sulfurtransferase TusA family protein [Azospirillum halopraeferens]|uniref:sulfurtransferase TusA family protein n=1 Tax=Azospirillum halopraeferens TaxID=34010 RepID=UPI0003F5DEA3|nr:sulfurtransferase TusA family protein [Azospirillum halopraeferens]
MSRRTIDARNAFCPGPLMELIAAIKASTPGDEVEVLSSDRASADDIPAWARKIGHDVVACDRVGEHWSIVIRKAR